VQERVESTRLRITGGHKRKDKDHRPNKARASGSRNGRGAWTLNPLGPMNSIEKRLGSCAAVIVGAYGKGVVTQALLDQLKRGCVVEKDLC